MESIEKFKLLCDENYIYFDNPSCMMLVRTREWLNKELEGGAEAYGPFGSFINSLKISRSKESLLQEKILPNLVFDGSYYQHKDSLSEANLI